MTGKYVVNMSTDVKGGTLPRGLVVEVRTTAAGRLEVVNLGDGTTYAITKAQAYRNLLQYCHVEALASEVAK